MRQAVLMLKINLIKENRIWVREYFCYPRRSFHVYFYIFIVHGWQVNQFYKFIMLLSKREWVNECTGKWIELWLPIVELIDLQMLVYKNKFLPISWHIRTHTPRISKCAKCKHNAQWSALPVLDTRYCTQRILISAVSVPSQPLVC